MTADAAQLGSLVNAGCPVCDEAARWEPGEAGGLLVSCSVCGLNRADADAVESRLEAEARGLSLASPIDLADLLARKMPPRRWLIDGLVQERDLAMIHAYRGVGKTRVAHGLGVAVAGGGSFLKWHAPEPRGVLLVDGELPREELQKMLAEAIAVADREPTAPLRVLSADLADAPILSLATTEGRQQIERHLAGVSLLILDSITTLCPGAGPENDAESWEGMQAWMLDLRLRGIAVELVHHDGKGGRQRGTSKREDVLSTVVQLRRPDDYRPSQGALFEVHFTKARAIVGEAADPFEARLGIDDKGRPAWTWRPLEDARAIRVRQLHEEGLTQRDIAKEIGVGLGTVNRALNAVGTAK